MTPASGTRHSALSLVGDDPMSGKWMQLAVCATRAEAQAEIDDFLSRIEKHSD